jgi:hypothetical protein
MTSTEPDPFDQLAKLEIGPKIQSSYDIGFDMYLLQKYSRLPEDGEVGDPYTDQKAYDRMESTDDTA